MKEGPSPTDHLSQRFILDELFDLTLYKRLRPLASKEYRTTIDTLIKTETIHVAFWLSFFGETATPKLTFWQSCKLHLLVFCGRLGRDSAIHLILEAIEVHGVRKYLRLWEETQNDAKMRTALEHILRDELEHEDILLSGEHGSHRLRPETIRNVFLGFNDGSVEILGAVSGFSAAFSEPMSILIAGLTVAVAGSLSMAAGAYMAGDSEREVEATERRKQRLLKNDKRKIDKDDHPSAISSTLIVGIFYLVGAAVPVIPFAFDIHSPWPSILLSGTLILTVSSIIAFLSGMKLAHRLRTNVTVIFLTVVTTYAIGLLARSVFGVQA